VHADRPGRGAEDLVAFGLVGKPHGLRGEVYVLVDPDFDEPLRPGRRVRTDRARELDVTGTRLQAGRLVATFSDVRSREDAEALRGARLLLPRRELESGDADAYWAEDLVGSEVVTDDGDVVGVLEAVADGPAHDYLVVARPDGGELLIPAVEEFVEIREGQVVLHPIQGLLD
jgi:16S rRNA processing protein RimM